MPLQTYRNGSNEVPNEDVMQCLSQLENNSSEGFTRFVMRGKQIQKVPVLLTKEMTELLDFLVDKRGVNNGVLDMNKCFCQTEFRHSSSRFRMSKEVYSCKLGEKT